jgi:hypothetical protein
MPTTYTVKLDLKERRNLANIVAQKQIFPVM